MSFELARKKAFDEWSWSAAIIIIMTVGLTGWIVVPGIGHSLESGFSAYANAVGTYIIVGNNGAPSAFSEFISSDTIAQIGTIAGVQSVFPVDINYTYFYFPNYTLPPPPGQPGPTIRGAVVGAQSAVLGAAFGFPSSLLNVTSGHAPEGDEAGFIVNTPYLLNLDNGGKPYTVGQSANVSIGGINFTATAVGVNSYNPLVSDAAEILWNSTYIRNELGD